MMMVGKDQYSVTLDIDNDDDMFVFLLIMWVGLMVKNMCFFLRGHMFKSKGVGYVYFRRLCQ
jgi:hypothetical protein